MKNSVIKKINKIGRIGEAVTRIIKIVLVLAFLVVVVCMVFISQSTKGHFNVRYKEEAIIEIGKEGVGKLFIESAIKNTGTGNSFFEIDNMKHIVSGVADEGDYAIIDTYSESYLFNQKRIMILFIMELLRLFFVFISLHFVSYLCKGFRDCETPFSEGIVNGMQSLAFSFLPIVVLNCFINSIESYFTSGKIEVSIDVFVVVLIVMIFLLIAIFRYGAMLQQESDETL